MIAVTFRGVLIGLVPTMEQALELAEQIEEINGAPYGEADLYRYY